MKYRPIPWLLLFICLLAAPVAAAETRLVPNSPEEISPLPVGSPFPSVILQTLLGDDFDLTAHLKKQPTILIYFRGGW